MSEVDGESGRNDLEAPSAAMDMDSTGNNSQGGTPTLDEISNKVLNPQMHQKLDKLKRI